MARPDGSASMRMWGGLLRRYREAAGMTREELAAHVGYSVSLVISVERGVRMPSPFFVPKADTAVKADGWLTEAAQHLSRDRLSGADADNLAEEERRARALWAYDTHVLHPLLRTEAYSRAVLWAHRPVLPDAEIDARVTAERERQARMTAEPACGYSFIIEEWILHRPTGGPAAMKAQLDHLAALAELRNVTLQVMPTSHQAHAGLGGAMTLVQTPEHPWFAALDLHGVHYHVHEPDCLTTLHDRYTHLRSLALTPEDSVRLMRRLAEELEAQRPQSEARSRGE